MTASWNAQVGVKKLSRFFGEEKKEKKEEGKDKELEDEMVANT